jgi:hypothetical protein
MYSQHCLNTVCVYALALTYYPQKKQLDYRTKSDSLCQVDCDNRSNISLTYYKRQTDLSIYVIYDSPITYIIYRTVYSMTN